MTPGARFRGSCDRCDAPSPIKGRLKLNAFDLSTPSRRRCLGTKKLADESGAFTPTGVNIRQWLGLTTISAAMVVATRAADSPAPEIELPRPGAVIATDVTGEVALIAGDERKVIKTDDRLRVGATIVTARKSFVSLLLSNGTTLQLGPESELEIEEFGQLPVTDGTKFAQLTAEPTVSRT